MTVHASAHAECQAKTQDPTDIQTLQTRDAACSRTDTPHIIGPNVSLSGILQVTGDVWVQGTLEADIRCRNLLIAPHAHVDGVLVAERVEVFGTVLGEVFCDKAVVKETGRVEAELNYRELELEPGGLFEGRSRRYEHPIAQAPAFSQ